MKRPHLMKQIAREMLEHADPAATMQGTYEDELRDTAECLDASETLSGVLDLTHGLKRERDELAATLRAVLDKKRGSGAHAENLLAKLEVKP